MVGRSSAVATRRHLFNDEDTAERSSTVAPDSAFGTRRRALYPTARFVPDGRAAMACSLLPITLGQFLQLNFAHRVSRQLADQNNAARDFEAGQMGATMLDYFVSG